MVTVTVQQDDSTEMAVEVRATGASKMLLAKVKL